MIEHLLKLEHGRQREPSAGWRQTVVAQRTRLDPLLADSPSLRSYVEEEARNAFLIARADALEGFARREPALLEDYRSALPTELPYSVEQLLDPGFLPTP